MDETAASAIYALDGPQRPNFPALNGAHKTKVAIIGGGFTGLSTALHLAQAGEDVTLLEAHHPGWGASGRNGGQLNPGLKFDPSELYEMFGAERGEKMVAFSWSTVEQLAAIISGSGIDCEFAQTGTIRAAASAADVAVVRRSQQDMAKHGMPVDWLEPEALAALVGHRRYFGGFLDRRGGAVNPLLLSFGLARAAAGAGARIHAQSRALRLQREGQGWRLETAQGSLLAERVLLCCNGYTDALVPGLAQGLVPVFSSVLASEPLSPSLIERIVPGRQVVYESGLVTVYYRVDAKNRLIIGGRGPMRPIDTPHRLRPIASIARHLWPELAHVGWRTAWNGRVAVTTDHLPHVHELEEGLIACYGYNGRGVALSNALGAPLAECLSAKRQVADLPIPVSPLRRIAFHSLWPLGVHATIAWSRLRHGRG